MLQCNLSPNNLLVNEDEHNIDMDLAIKQGREASWRLGHFKLDDELHAFMHNLESLSQVFF
jgi:hypothetical protein